MLDKLNLMCEDDIIELLKDADNAYYNSETSMFSDEFYDELKDKAQMLYPDNEYFQSVGAPVPTKSQKIKHDYVLGSLKKFKTDTISSWIKKFSSDEFFCIMPKLDGASIFVRYENGELVLATTRGDGHFGFDITHKALKFLPKKIKNKNRVDLRGECLLNKNIFASLGFSNTRNGVAGLLNKDGVEGCENIDCLFYEYINSTNESLIVDFNELTEMGIDVVEYHLLSELKVEELKSILVSMKIDYCYDLDGLVICPTNHKRENVERPENKIAFKVNSEGIETEIDYIEWNVSRTGRVVPIAIFKSPVPIDGTNVSKATAHNAKYVLDNKIGISSKVKIVKSGDIIPQIIEVTIPAAKMDMAKNCPSCGSELEMKGVDLICKNKKCYEQVIGFLEYFFRVLGAENISSQTFRNLKVKDLTEVFELTVDNIMNRDGFGETSASMIIDEIHKSIKNVKPETLLAAVGVPFFGTKNTKKFIDSLDKSLTSKEKFESIFSLNENLFTSIPGFGKSIFKSVVDSLENVALVYRICQNYGLTFNEETLSEESSNVVKVTVTGKGPASRKELEKLFKEHGFEIINFSNETEILVCDDLNSSSSKMKKAKKNNIKIVTYEEFFNEYQMSM
jgi:DNA ligase (NAD+)